MTLVAKLKLNCKCVVILTFNLSPYLVTLLHVDKEIS